MQTNLQQISPVEYELEITATADDLAPEIEKALRDQRARTNLKGFRPGKVPLQMVKKMHGKALAYAVAEKTVQETYEAEILEAKTHRVLGQPKLTALEYEMDGDLRAVIRFGVRPEIELADLSGEKVSKLVHEVEEGQVDEEIAQLRRRHADLVPSEEAAGEEDHVVIDLQRLDDESGTPLIGEKEEDVAFFLDDERLKDELKEAVLGKKAGDTFKMHMTHEHGHDGHEGTHTHGYQVTVKEVKRRELPELDAEFVKEVTKEQFEDVDAFRAEIERQLRESWERSAREMLEGDLVERMLALHPVPVPASAVELYLDSFVEDVRRRSEGEMPAGFDEQAFRDANRGEAERQARWMLIRDQIIEENGLEVGEDDLEAYFEQAAEGGNFPASMLRQYYQSMPGMMDQVQQRMLSEKVFDLLLDRFDVVEKEREEYEAEMKARQEAEAPAAEEG